MTGSQLARLDMAFLILQDSELVDNAKLQDAISRRSRILHPEK